MIIFWVLAPLILLFGFVVFWGAPYVPSRKKELSAVFSKLYALSEHDTLLDLGSGDGRVVRAAAAKHAQATGYEINPALVAIANMLKGGDRRQTFVLKNAWNVTFPSQTTVVYSFGVTRDAVRLQQKMQAEANRLQKTLHLISYGGMVANIEPSKTLDAHYLYKFTPLHAK